MSFRHTYVTEFLYKHDRDEELNTIKEELEKYGTVHWQGSSTDPQLGYFHGVIKDSDGYDTKESEHDILHAIESVGAKIKIVYE